MERAHDGGRDGHQPHQRAAHLGRHTGSSRISCKTFKLSNDREFVEKVEDVVGLYLDPPDKALVLCVDEKSQIQALDRTQPGLPMKKGRAGTMTHDYKRNGTTTLFAALDVPTGTVIGECMPRHRAQEFLRFLKTIDRQTPAHLDLHLIARQLRHPQDAGGEGLARAAPRFHLHFTPTSRSWLNLVERLFAEITTTAHPARHLHQRRRTRSRHRRMDRPSKPKPKTVQMDRHRQNDFVKHCRVKSPPKRTQMTKPEHEGRDLSRHSRGRPSS